ncbi:TAM domain methyltransferase [Moelleriella libera RCEF 2490]|uniref:TAM domain methyltransferase n=1 Tax=Moelleriella libera RCEF 2490 TaxID=1081109 RepID=A0A166VBA9_9HYPO|nr:TAM domain methyltransferase [Moelleriella libera RCEF 2490]
MDTDSTYGEDNSNASTSIYSAITRYEWKHGRRYHAYQSGSYSFPNDEREQDRLDMLHHAITRLLDGRLFLAPIQPNGLKILDIGTGTGIWPISMGDTYPGAFVTGNDLSPIQPSWVPNNVKFLVDDVELDWVQSSQYDYIHCRYMAASIKDWPRLMRQIHESLKPGGWVEFQESASTYKTDEGELLPTEVSDELHPTYAFRQLNEALRDACATTGRTFDPTPHLCRWATESGFQNAKQTNFQVPVGNWPKDQRNKEIGNMMAMNFTEGVEAMTAVLVRDVLAWPAEEVEMLNARVRLAAKNKDLRLTFDYVVVTAQKHV